MIAFDDWGPQARDFFRSRRLAPFGDSGSILEQILRQRIEKEQEQMRAFGAGKYKNAFLSVFDLLDAVDIPYPMDLLHTVLEHFYDGDVEKIAPLLANWENGGKQKHQQNIVAYIEEVDGTLKELLRHYTLLPEQRERLQFMQRHSEARELGDFIAPWLAEKGIPATEQEMTRQACLFSWAHVWRLVLRNEILSPPDWERLYYSITTVMTTPGLYQDLPFHSWELAERSYVSAPDPVRKLLGGLLYAKVLEVEGVQALKNPMIAELGALLAANDVFASPSFIRFDPHKDVGYFAEDPTRSFVFKRTTQQEVDALSGIASIMMEPTMTYYRLASRYSSQFSFQEGQIPRSGAAFDVLLADAKTNPMFKRYFEIPCVKLGGLVLKLLDNTYVLSMHHEGKTLSEQLDTTSDTTVKMDLCRDALTMLSKFHLIITENLVCYGDNWYPSAGFHGYKGLHPIPQIKYGQLLERRITGTKEVPRFPKNSLLEAVLAETEAIGAFLAHGCLGAVVIDANDSNITEHGIIDVAKFSIANFYYDVACFLYGNSFARKKDLDLAALREYYIATFIEIVSETNVLRNGQSEENFEINCRDYALWRTRDEFLAAHTEGYHAMMRTAQPRASSAFIEAQCSRSLIDLTLTWDFCQPHAAERMREYCQAAAIVMSMGEVGSLLHQYSYSSSDRKDFLEKELQYAVVNSLALMRQQGFMDLSEKWFVYLAVSGKLPDSYFKQETLLPKDIFIPDLAVRVFSAVYAPPRTFLTFSPPSTYL